VDDAFDAVFEGDEAEESDIMNQIYDEIGIDMSSKVNFQYSDKKITTTFHHSSEMHRQNYPKSRFSLRLLMPRSKLEWLPCLEHKCPKSTFESVQFDV